MRRSLDRFCRSILPKRTQRVVYTCLFGGSEAFMNRRVVRDGRTAFICFTDDRSLKSKDWKFIYIDPRELGPAKTCKLIKTCPHRFLSAFSSSLYVDNTVRIDASPSAIWRKLSRSTPFVAFRHPWWDCPYREAEELVKNGYVTKQQIEEQMTDYASRGFPKNAGMFHGAILLRRHNDQRVRSLCEDWFSEIRKYSYRDQIPLSFLVWKSRFTMGIFGGRSDREDNGLVKWPDFIGPRVPRNICADQN